MSGLIESVKGVVNSVEGGVRCFDMTGGGRSSQPGYGASEVAEHPVMVSGRGGHHDRLSSARSAASMTTLLCSNT